MGGEGKICKIWDVICNGNYDNTGRALVNRSHTFLHIKTRFRIIRNGCTTRCVLFHYLFTVNSVTQHANLHPWAARECQRAEFTGSRRVRTYVEIEAEGGDL